MMLYGMPGIGGSLGKCAVCGKDFAFEILTGKNVSTFKMPQFTQELCAHEKCMDELVAIKESGGDWHKLPLGPIREAFERGEA